MKAIVCDKYGSPDVLRLEEVPKPTPSDDEVLVKVHAASVNSADFELLRGKPWLIRLGGLRRPMHRILGSDIAGRVEAVGRNVKEFQPGDEVFGDISRSGWGGFAEYVCAPESALVAKPASLAFEEAAAVPQTAVMALQGLRQYGNIQTGQKVLINGAGGGVGSFAVQMVRSFGAEVTGVDSAMKLDMMASIGADHVIDYAKEDFTKNGKHYDLIIDCALHRSIRACKRALSPGGRYVMIGGSMTRVFGAMLVGRLVSPTKGKRMILLVHRPNKDLALIIEFLEAGKVVPVIDQRYTLLEVPEAVRYIEEGRSKGKLVITMGAL